MTSAQEQAVLDVLRDVLGTNALGVYVHGSAVMAGLRPASDLDLLVVVEGSLTPAARAGLAERLIPISGPQAGGRSIEVTVVVAGQVRPWRYPPIADFLYGDWLRDEIATSGPPRPGAMPNLAIEIRTLLAHGRILDGPPPAELLDPVPPGDVQRAGRDGIPGLLADLTGDERNVLLTLARIAVTVATDAIVDKAEAAAWALPRLPEQHRPGLAHARLLYLTSTYADETWPAGLLERVPACAAALVDLIAPQVNPSVRPPWRHGWRVARGPVSRQ